MIAKARHEIYRFGLRLHQYTDKNDTLHKKCSYLELFWSVFSRIRTEYGEILSMYLYSVRMRENTDQNKSKYGHFLSTESQVDSLLGWHTRAAK